MSEVDVRRWIPGDRVKFLGASQAQNSFVGCDDPNKVCIVGKIYELRDIKVYNWYTHIWLEGVTGKFNSVCFEWLEGYDIVAREGAHED